MGQQEVIEAIEELGITSLRELQEKLSASTPSISRALMCLTKYNEVYGVRLSQKTVYLSKEIYEEMRLQNE